MQMIDDVWPLAYTITFSRETIRLVGRRCQPSQPSQTGTPAGCVVSHQGWRHKRQCIKSIGRQKLEHTDHELGRSKNGRTAGRFAASILGGQQGFGASIARPTLQYRGQVRQPLQQQRAMCLLLLIAGTLSHPVSAR